MNAGHEKRQNEHKNLTMSMLNKMENPIRSIAHCTFGRRWYTVYLYSEGNMASPHRLYIKMGNMSPFPPIVK